MSTKNCIYCGELLRGMYYNDAWGGSYCARHHHDFPACSFCYRLIPPRAEPGYDNGLDRACVICRAAAIDSYEQARPLFRIAISWLNRQGLWFNNLKLRIELHDRRQLNHFLSPGDGDIGSRAIGAAQSVYLGNAAQAIVRPEKVVLLRGMPDWLFTGVTVHELGHIWLAVHQIRGLSRRDEEGFCELLEYRYESQQQNLESSIRMRWIANNRDPVYGDGFRHVSAIARRISFEQLIERLRRERTMPRLG